MKSHLTGSSPLTRGTPIEIKELNAHLRFIPAYAGNSHSSDVFVGPKPVHPRLRGELLSTVWQVQIRGRFIPAYAGNSPILLS